MTIEMVRQVLGWCTLVNFGVLLLWVVLYVFGRSLIFRLHGRWFPLTDEQFAALHYGGMGIYKIGILLFNLIPYLALLIVA